MRARTGKIARLPLETREALNRRLLQNEPARTILAWLNALPETARVIAEMNARETHPGGFQAKAIDEKNLSDWRAGGFADWLRHREQIERIRNLAAYSLDLAKAKGGDISQGASALAAGRILEALEIATAENGNPAALKDLVAAVTSLRAGDIAQQNAEIAKQKAEISRQQVAQRDREIDLANMRFHRDTCALFVKWSENETARQIANGQASNEEKIEQLGKLMFGDDWKT